MAEIDQAWLDSINEKLHVALTIIEASPSIYFMSSIHRVPERLRKYDKKEYMPQIISIGPFHYDERKDQLRFMEQCKWMYLHEILSRNGEHCLKQLLRSVKELEARARLFYSQEIDLDSNSFVEMMVLDGCFLIELFFIERDEDYLDRIIEMEYKNALVIDLLMLENQIPFFILEHLSKMLYDSKPRPVEGALCFFQYLELFQKLLHHPHGTIDHSERKVLHLLHLLHTTLIFFTEEEGGRSGGKETIHCASKLQKEGIKFQKRDHINEKDNFLGIKFQKGGVIEIPPIVADDMMNPMFLNLVAFEQCYPPCKKYITAYITFMDCLIDTQEDVGILCENGIIEKRLRSDEDVAVLFNNMGRESILDDSDFYLSAVCCEINRHCDKIWPKLKETVKRDYFKNYFNRPWAIIIAFGATLALILTLIQTFFAAFPKFAYGR